MKPLFQSVLLVTLGLGVLQVPPCATSQEPKPERGDPFKMAVTVNFVTVPVTVRDAQGKFVKGLPLRAFRILEDSREQEIVSFTQQGAPLWIAIVLDSSGSAKKEWENISEAAFEFIERVAREDTFAIYTFSDQVRLRLDWGRDRSLVLPVLSSVRCDGRSAIWDALRLVAEGLAGAAETRKAILLITHGLDNQSSVRLEEALEAAIGAETALYIIISKTEAVRQNTSGRSNTSTKEFVQADLALRKLAQRTGGRVLYPELTGDLKEAFRETVEELRGQYVLGYVSTNGTEAPAYRRIEVRVDYPGARVSARPGYFPKGVASGEGPVLSNTERDRDSVPVAAKKPSESPHVSACKKDGKSLERAAEGCLPCSGTGQGAGDRKFREGQDPGQDCVLARHKR